MQEYHEDDLTGLIDVLETFPFLQSFPFGEYTITLEKGESYTDMAGIDPVVISEAGGMVAPEFVNFYHVSKDTKIALTFYTYDINFIHESANKIKKLDSVREVLDLGISSNDILTKIDCIKKGERFLKKIGSSLIAGRAFDSTLDQFLVEGKHVMSKADLTKIKKVSRTLESDRFHEEVKDIIVSFYNIHLHHVKILLGVVIASKIH